MERRYGVFSPSGKGVECDALSAERRDRHVLELSFGLIVRVTN
jgi:hypothetical protein